MTESDVYTLAGEAISRLNHAPQLSILRVDHDEKFDIWDARFHNAGPGGRQEFTVGFKERGRSKSDLIDLLTHELRQQLWSCPLCDRPGYIDRQGDMTFFVECPTAGRFLITHPAIFDFRRAWDRKIAEHLEKLAFLEAYVQRHQNGKDVLTITADNWQGLVEEQRHKERR